MADQSPVSHITEDMVERGARAFVGAIFRREFEDSHNKHIDLARAVLSAALAGCTVVDLPELIELPKFQGCTNSNPDLCACGESALMCAACDEEIEDGARAYTFREKLRPWLSDTDSDQEWNDVWWHVSCDGRGSVSPKGGETE